METKELEKFVKGLQKNYKFIFNTEEGKEVLTAVSYTHLRAHET